MLVFPLVPGDHAKPKRGAQSFLSGKFAPVGAFASPGNNIPFGAFGKIVDCCPKAHVNERPCRSFFGELCSYRTPRLNVKLRRIFHSSWKKPLTFLDRILLGAAGYCRNSSANPSMKSARSFLV